VFCSDVDLELHLAHFGRKATFHQRKLRSERYWAMVESRRRRDGADMVVREMANIILSYNRKRPVREIVCVPLPAGVPRCPCSGKACGFMDLDCNVCSESEGVLH
jgi:hypothetical protein